MISKLLFSHFSALVVVVDIYLGTCLEYILECIFIKI